MNPVASGERKLGLHRKFLCPIMLSAAFEPSRRFKNENASEKKLFSLASIF
jgi:hypothetical protein